MKWNIERKTLLATLAGAEMVVHEKMGFSISATVQLQADPDEMRIIANNSEMTFCARPGGEVENTGALCVSHARLYNTVREMPECKLKLWSDEELVLHIQPQEGTRRLTARINGISTEDFPPLPIAEEDSVYLSVEKSYFRRMIQRVSFAVAAQATKYALNGVFFECKENKVAMVASDGRRLAVANMFLADKIEDFSLILPHSFLTGAARLINGDGALQIHYNEAEGRIYFTFDSFVISSSLIGGEYPAYQEFLPSESEKRFVASTGALEAAVRSGGVMYDNMSTPKVVFSISPSTLSVDAKDKSYGDVHEKIDVEYDGTPMQMAFNARLLSEILHNFESDQTEFGFSASESPVVIRENMSSEFVYVLMPMRLPEKNTSENEGVQVSDAADA